MKTLIFSAIVVIIITIITSRQIKKFGEKRLQKQKESVNDFVSNVTELLDNGFKDHARQEIQKASELFVDFEHEPLRRFKIPAEAYRTPLTADQQNRYETPSNQKRAKMIEEILLKYFELK